MSTLGSHRANGAHEPLAFSIEPHWIDYNGHLNMARYPMLFDRAIDALIDRIGLSSEDDHGDTLFAAEAQLRYVRAVYRGDTPTVTTQVLRVDGKRVHTWQTMRVEGEIVSTCENLHLCVSRSGDTSRVTAFPPTVLEALEALAIPLDRWPNDCGRPIASRMGER